MSCSSPARRRSRRVTASKPSTAPIPTAISATRSEWRAVNGDLASMTRANASAIRSSRASSATSSRSAGSQPETSGCSSDAQNAGVDREQRVDQRRVEPAPAPLARHLAGGLDAAGGVEDLGGLGEAEDPREQRDLLAAQPVGHAAPVPVLVEAADRGRGLLGQVEHARDLGPAVAARLHELARDLALVLDPPQERHALAQRASRRDRPHRPQERLERARPVDQLRRALGQPVVGAEQRGHALGVGGAAGVLEQQRVEEVGAGAGRELELLGDPHPDHAGADRVPRGLAFGDVERVRERADDPGERDVLHTRVIGWTRRNWTNDAAGGGSDSRSDRR